MGGFCIDRWEAHLVTVAPVAGRLSPFLPPRGNYRAHSAAQATPQAYISRTEAARACENSGKRLCRAREWFAACSTRGEFPYGPSERSGLCNVEKEHLPSRLFGQKVHLSFEYHYNSARLNQVPGFLAASGAYAECRTQEGVYDMVGNLHEWVSDAVSRGLRKEIPLSMSDAELGARGNGVFMGGYFSSHGEHGRGCRYTTTHHAPEYHDYSIGFRCCSDESAGPRAVTGASQETSLGP